MPNRRFQGFFAPKQARPGRQTKTEILKNDFTKYGFYELDIVQKLQNNNADKLIEKINEGNLPYKIAMIHFLGFIEHLGKQYSKSKDEMFKKAWRYVWFECKRNRRKY